MILREIFTSFDSSVVKQSELIYAMRDFSVMADLSDPLRAVNLECPIDRKKIFHKPKYNYR